MNKIYIFVLFIFLFSTNACSSNKSIKNINKNSKAKFYKEWNNWKKLHIKNYSYKVKIFCFCPGVKPEFVVVKDGKVISKNSNIAKSKTIDEYFLLIQKAYNKNANKIKISYDSKYHYPKDIYIDYDKMLVDEEIGYTISNFSLLK